MSALLRRLRALLRPPSRIEGFVDGCVAGEIRGWALAPREPGRRVHVVALCEGQVVAEALADLSRVDLLQDGRGDGRHGFRLKLPPALLDGAARTVRVEAVAGGGRERLIRGEIEIRPPEPAAASQNETRGESPFAEPRPLALAQGLARLVIWGEDDEAIGRTEADWRAQDWLDRDLVRLESGTSWSELGENVHTVVFVRAGDRLDPAAARLLVQARPLGDVVTWSGRSEARALGVLAGESLGGAFAVRGHVLAAAPPTASLRALELWLASRGELRWAHLAAPVATRRRALDAAAPIRAEDALGLDGLALMSGARLVPTRLVERITLAAWPAGTPEALASLAALLAVAPDAEIELLTTPETAATLQDLIDAKAGVSIRPVDPPREGGAGAWLRVLCEAASGEAIVLVRGGVQPDTEPHALEELAAWALSPRVGAATLAIDVDGRGRLDGLGLAREGSLWRAASAYDPALEGRSRPVLGAPAAFMAVAKAKLAAIGGIDDLRCPDRGADLDLGLRLRRAGWPGLLLGHLTARLDREEPLAHGADLAAFDAAELASAALAYPAGRDR